MKRTYFSVAMCCAIGLLSLGACDDSSDDLTSLDAAPTPDTATADASDLVRSDAAVTKAPDASDALSDVALSQDAAAADTAPSPSVEGNIERDGFPKAGSVAFVLVGSKYHFFQAGSSVDTSISYISPDGTTAYGWYRDKPLSDPTNRDTAFSLNLHTGRFTPIPFEDSRASIVRGGNGTKLVGKMIFENGTPEDKKDDLRRGFLFDTVTKKSELVKRDGYSDIGFTAINSAGVITGFNDFGELGFIYADGKFTDLKHPDAYRLFPFAINDAGVIVGVWGKTEADWFEEGASPSFIASRKADGSIDVKKYELAGYAGVDLTGLNNKGQFCGNAYKKTDSVAVVIRGASLTSEVEFVPIDGKVQPFATGIDERGWISGQLFILDEVKVCGGHGALNSDSCTCDTGYLVDAYDKKNCIPLNAECNGHGHTHADAKCHCDQGFRQNPDNKAQCLPL